MGQCHHRKLALILMIAHSFPSNTSAKRGYEGQPLLTAPYCDANNRLLCDVGERRDAMRNISSKHITPPPLHRQQAQKLWRKKQQRDDTNISRGRARKMKIKNKTRQLLFIHHYQRVPSPKSQLALAGPVKSVPCRTSICCASSLPCAVSNESISPSFNFLPSLPN